jgi:hypothetical protein
MAQRLKEAYRSLFQANEYAWKLNKNDLQAKLKQITGAADDDPYLPAVASTFTELSKLASWDGAAPPKRGAQESTNDTGTPERRERESAELSNGGLRLGYTINLNLPATTEIEVFNAIFKSLRENLLMKL